MVALDRPIEEVATASTQCYNHDQNHVMHLPFPLPHWQRRSSPCHQRTRSEHAATYPQIHSGTHGKSWATLSSSRITQTQTFNDRRRSLVQHGNKMTRSKGGGQYQPVRRLPTPHMASSMVWSHPINVKCMQIDTQVRILRGLHAKIRSVGDGCLKATLAESGDTTLTP
jgi:hypothetical protein